jgi:hypothetical protein
MANIINDGVAAAAEQASAMVVGLAAAGDD